MFKKRITSMLLALCMLSSITVPVWAAFKDVPSDSQYKDCITKMADAGVIKGITNDTFGYGTPCTRAQFITFLYRAAGSPESEKPSGFTDVPADSYYADAISWAFTNGIAKGFEDNTFGVGLTVDRSHAASFLYEWAKVTGYGNTKNSCTLSNYADSKDIDYYLRTPLAWAVAEGIIVANAENELEHKEPVTREWVAGAISTLQSRHYHKWADYKDNSDGTHTRICELDSNHIETEAHTFNNGELTTKATETSDGEITYTCTKCMATKTEKVPAGTEITTRKDLEDAIASVSWSYYTKGPRIQYDSREFSGKLTTYRGGLGRLTAISPPELSTKDNTFYSVCSDYVYQVYDEALNRKMLGEVTHPFGFSTAYIYAYADNQLDAGNHVSCINDPLSETDVDACVIRYINYDLCAANNQSKINSCLRSNVFESESFTDYTTGLQFKSDGTDDKAHYSYYDEAGNKLTYDDVRNKYVVPFIDDYEKNLRVGDVIMCIGHAIMYVGNNTFLHCNGQKVSRTTPATELIETNGAIFADVDYIRLFAESDSLDLFVVTRPLEFVTSPCFDEDPGNDVVIDTKIPENTKSRMKYPQIDIDRTVDITHFGTAVSGENLTYTIEIANRTNDEKYLEWFSKHNQDKSGAVSYKDIKVTETIPEGTEFVADSIVGGGKIENGVITWNIDEIKSGETVTLSYTVKVTAPIGATIKNAGGMVDNIPSNEIINTVGGEKLDDTEKKNLSDIGSYGVKSLAQFGKDADFANSIYKKLGKELNLPPVQEIAENLFTIKSHIPGDTLAVGGWYSPSYTPIDLFVRQDEVSDDYKAIKSMIIDRYWGGESFFVGEDLKWDYATNGIKEFRADYLEAGDIIVYIDVVDNADKTMTYNPNEVVVMVYDGDKLLSVSDTNDATSYKIYEGDEVDAQLLSAIETRYDLFFALRPSQASK